MWTFENCCAWSKTKIEKENSNREKKKNIQDMECYTTGPTTPNNSSTFYDNNNYGDQQLSNEHHNQHYYGYPCQNYMEPLCPVSQQPANSAETILPDNSAELWAAQQSCFSLSNDSIHSSQTGKFF